MPSKSRAQHNLMAGCAHGMKSKKCPPLKVSREFAAADKASGKYRKGGKKK